MKQWAVLMVIAIALSGCTEDEPVDPASQCDLETNYVDENDECVPHVEPSMVVNGLPESLMAYHTAEFTWDLDPGTRALDGSIVHSMDSRIKASMDDTAPTNVTGPDDWGTEIERQQHKDFPQNFTGRISWEETGHLHLYGFMLINGQNIWQDLGTVEITPVVATGNRTEVHVEGAPPALSEREVTVTVGDGVTFHNDQGFAYDVTFDGDDCPDGGTLAAGGTFDADFLVPGSCSYTLASPITMAGQGDLSGKVTVSTP